MVKNNGLKLLIISLLMLNFYSSIKSNKPKVSSVKPNNIIDLVEVAFFGSVAIAALGICSYNYCKYWMLKRALKNNDILKVKACFNKVRNVNTSYQYCLSPLHLACKFGNLEVVKWLVEEKNADVNLIIQKIVNTYYQSGRLASFRVAQENVALHIACQAGNLDIVRYLLDKNANPIVKANYRSPIMIVVNKKRLDIFKCLVDKIIAAAQAGANIDLRLDINYVCKYGTLEMAQYLADRLNHTDIIYFAHRASSNNRLDIIKYLADNDNFDSEMVASNVCGFGTLDMAKYLVEEKDLDVDTSYNNQLILDTAIEEGNLDVMKYLVEKGASVNNVDVVPPLAPLDGPIHKAAKVNHLGALKYLVSRGADVENKGFNDKTPLHYASEYGNFKAVKFLVGNDAPIDSEDTSGRTPVYYACKKGNIYIFKYLLKVGANIDFLSDNPESDNFGEMRSETILRFAKYVKDKSKELKDVVKSLKEKLTAYDDEDKKENVRQLKSLVAQIRDLMLKQDFITHAKQSVIPDLIWSHRRLNNVLTAFDIRIFIGKISFNKRFFADGEFECVIDFEKEFKNKNRSKRLKDLFGRSIYASRYVYGDSTDKNKILSTMLEENEDFYNQEKLAFTYLEKYGDCYKQGLLSSVFEKTKGVLLGFYNFITRNEVCLYSLKDKRSASDFDVITNNLKHRGKKKKFRRMLNAAVISDDLKKLKGSSGRNLPNELVGKITAFAVDDEFAGKKVMV